MLLRRACLPGPAIADAASLGALGSAGNDRQRAARDVMQLLSTVPVLSSTAEETRRFSTFAGVRSSRSQFRSDAERGCREHSVAGDAPLACHTPREGGVPTLILVSRFLMTFSSCFENQRLSAARSLSSNPLTELIPLLAVLAVAVAAHCRSMVAAEGGVRRRAIIDIFLFGLAFFSRFFPPYPLGWKCAPLKKRGRAAHKNDRELTILAAAEEKMSLASRRWAFLLHAPRPAVHSWMHGLESPLLA